MSEPSPERAVALGAQPRAVTVVAAVAPSRAGLLRDLVCLGKPGITISNVLMVAGAMVLAPTRPAAGVIAAALAGAALVVAAANAFNMYLERSSDRLMARTRRRPLPDGRLPPSAALWFGAVTAALGTAILAAAVNPLTAGLGALALFLYVCAYTPLKRRTAAALYVGAIPGALPPVMGWTAATGRIDAGALVLFVLLFAWQVPHFLAIAVWRRGDYAAAGIRTMAASRGERSCRRQALGGALALAGASIALWHLGVAGPLYLAAATALAGWLTARALSGSGDWGRRLFIASIWYLPAIVTTLALDRLWAALMS